MSNKNVMRGGCRSARPWTMGPISF